MEAPAEAEVDFSEVFSFDRIGLNARNLNYWYACPGYRRLHTLHTRPEVCRRPLVQPCLRRNRERLRRRNTWSHWAPWFRVLLFNYVYPITHDVLQYERPTEAILQEGRGDLDRGCDASTDGARIPSCPQFLRPLGNIPQAPTRHPRWACLLTPCIVCCTQSYILFWTLFYDIVHIY